MISVIPVRWQMIHQNYWNFKTFVWPENRSRFSLSPVKLPSHSAQFRDSQVNSRCSGYPLKLPKFPHLPLTNFDLRITNNGPNDSGVHLEHHLEITETTTFFDLRITNNGPNDSGAGWPNMYPPPPLMNTPPN